MLKFIILALRKRFKNFGDARNFEEIIVLTGDGKANIHHRSAKFDLPLLAIIRLEKQLKCNEHKPRVLFLNF